MWLVLEYDKDYQELAFESLKSNGITTELIRREDQLAHVDEASIDLVLVGSGWKAATLAQLKQDGVDAKFVYVVPTVSNDSLREAKELGCDDVVAYPLPVNYLRSWAKQTAEHETSVSVEREQTPIEKILARKNIGNQKRTYTQGATSTDANLPTMVRGRIVATYGIRGGIGKSTVTSLLATHLAGRNYSVAVVDIAPKGILLNLHRGQAAITVDDWSKMPAQMDERMVRQSLVKPGIGGFWLLPSGPNTAKLDPVHIKRTVYNIAQYFDWVLLDTVPDHDITTTALEIAHRVVYVAQPDWSSLKQTIDGYEELRSLKGPEAISMVINMVKKREHKFTLRALSEADIPSPAVEIKDDIVLRKEVQNARPMVGSGELRGAVADVVSTFGIDPVIAELKTQRKRWWVR